VHRHEEIEAKKAPHPEKRGAWIWLLIILGVAWTFMSIGAIHYH
jgi:hypothetical protein